mmetsp:Transcript_87509/g.175081  ORF Transcript_87509/g.175081 Transcript_87509/m.175081 type:complete len:227 (-) Transcript_87509:87-767(-)
MNFTGGEDADAELVADLVNVNRFEKSQLAEVASLVLDLLRDPRGSAFQERLGAFADTHGVNTGALKNVARGLIIFYRGAAKNNLNPKQVAEDCATFGLTEEAGGALAAAWEGAFRALASASVRSSVMANQVVDMEWKFGVTAASDELGQVGSTFLHLKLVIDKGLVTQTAAAAAAGGAGAGEAEGGGSLRKARVLEDVFMELTLPQFYEFMADMEKAKTYVDFLST